MDSLRRVFWSDGLFLTPQVFQQQDAFHIGMWRVLWRALGPNFWGIRHIELHEEGLRAGDFSVAKLDLVTRQGDVVRYGIAGREDNCVVRARHFGSALTPGQTEVNVYLAIAVRDGHRSNIMDRSQEAEADGAVARFVAGEREASDDFHPSSSEPSMLDLADFVVQFLIDTDPGFSTASSRYDCFQLARLRPVGGGAEPVQSFVPPVMMLGASPALSRLVRNMCAEVTRRTLEYEEIKNERSDVKGQESSARDALVKSMLLVLNRANAEFRILQSSLDRDHNSMSAHPEDVYNRVRVLISELSTFSTAVGSDGTITVGDKPVPLPDYDHEDPYPVFEKLSRALERALNALVINLEGQVELKFDGQHYAADLPETFFGGPKAIYYLAVDAENRSRDRVFSDVRDRIYKLSSGQMAERIIEVNAPGIDMEPLQDMPVELSLLTRRYACFRIDKGHPDWRNVENDKSIKFLAKEIDPSEAKILIIQSEPDRRLD